MTFADAVSMLTDGRAAKRANWGGYVYRKDEATSTSCDYSIVFRQKNYNASTAPEVPFEHLKDGSGWTSPAYVTMDPTIFEAMIADNWIVGKTTDFEAARSGTGTW